MFLNRLRFKMFFFIDAIKGGPIKKHLNEITTIQNSPNSESAERLRSNYMNDLLDHATATTPYYQKYAGKKKIEDFPVIKKSAIQEQFENFQSSSYSNKKNHKVSTSGSTGLSFFLFQNKNKRLRNYADSIYYYATVGFTFGNRIYKLIVWHTKNKKSNLEAWLLNMSQIDVSHFTDDSIAEFIRMLETDNQRNKAILSYASALDLIANYLKKRKLVLKDHGIDCIVAISEYLSPQTINTLQEYLGVPVYSRYSNEELGMVAQQTDLKSKHFEINHASYHVEILKIDQDEHVKPGEFGRIVVTDLHNYAMPMIRYDTGDIASYKLNDHGVMQLEKIEGRKMDVIYSTAGSIVSSFVTHAIFNRFYKEIVQYQFIQQGEKEYEIKLNVQSDTFEFENDLINNVKNELGEDALVSITYVNEIPPLASGKRRKVINNFSD